MNAMSRFIPYEQVDFCHLSYYCGSHLPPSKSPGC